MVRAPLLNFGKFVYPTLHVSLEWSNLSGVYARGSKRSYTGGKCETCRGYPDAVQKRRYPHAGTSPTKFHPENYWDGAAIVLGAIACAVYVLSGKVTGEVPHYIYVAYYGRSSPKYQ